MRNLVILFLDAFSYQYINEEDTPFLINQDVCPLTPVLGFKQLAAAFTGLDSSSTGLIAEHYFDPIHSPYRWIDALPSRLLPITDLIARRLIDKFIEVISHRRPPSRLLPLPMSKFFNLDDDPFPLSATILSLLEERRLSYRFIFYPQVRTNEETYKLFKSLHGRIKMPDFLLIHFPELDPITHKFGIESAYRRKLVKELDLIIDKIYGTLSTTSHLIVFSDHGMIKVDGQIDIFSKVKRIGHLGEDFLLFLDSVMARFWTFDDHLVEKITKFLENERIGQFFYCNEPKLRPFLGDLAFLCDPGYIVFPNYYDQTPPKAMHGYQVNSLDSPLNGIFSAYNLPIMSIPSSMCDLVYILRRAIESL